MYGEHRRWKRLFSAPFSCHRADFSSFFVQVFGVAPPQTLYHTRHLVSLPATPSKVTGHGAELVTHPSLTRNSSQSARLKRKARKLRRHPTSESQLLLQPSSGGSGDSDHSLEEPKLSSIYCHYEHSLNSLNDIIDRVGSTYISIFLCSFLSNRSG